jgi:hypothetical protein
MKTTLHFQQQYDINYFENGVFKPQPEPLMTPYTGGDNFSELFVAQGSLKTLDAYHSSWNILDAVRLRRRRKFR